MERRSVWGDWAWRTEVGSIELLVQKRQHVSKGQREGSRSGETVGLKKLCRYPCSGTAILLATCPVSVAATFTIPSVPAENKCPPSWLKHKLRQLPLCRRVRHAVLMVLLRASWASEEGRRWSWTWPEARPRARRGEVGWMA